MPEDLSRRLDDSDSLSTVSDLIQYKFVLIEYLQKNYPSSTAVIRVIEGNEPQEFVRLFPSWTEMDSNGNKMASLLGKFDAMTLVQRPHLAAESQLLDDGTGDLIIYRVSSNGDLVEIPKRKNVALFSGDCYLLHYIVPVSVPGIR